jgi:hypothetical protein
MISDALQCGKCNEIKPVSEFYVDKSKKRGYYYHCKVCYSRRNRKRPSDPRKVLYENAKRRATRKGIVFNITVDDIHIPSVCPLLGIPLTADAFGMAEDGSMSLDRINALYGYVADNIWVISNRANMIKSNASLQELKILTLNLERLQHGRQYN